MMLGNFGRETTGGPSQDLVVCDTQRLDPPLLPQRKRDEESKLDQLGLAEMRVEAGPQVVVGKVGVPDDRAGPGQRRLLTLVVSVGLFELQ